MDDEPIPVPFRGLIDTDSLLAQEMNKLSVQERLRALEDLHGVSTLIEEEVYVVNHQLLELDGEIRQHKNRAYRLAERLSEEYVKDRDFRLMFLRADSFDVKAAAQRMMRFFKFKLLYFGEQRLVRDITLNDLDEHDLACLETGTFQELGDRDRPGRAVFVAFQQLRRFRKSRNQVSGVALQPKPQCVPNLAH